MFRRIQAGDGVAAIALDAEVTGGCDCTDTECTFEDCAFENVVLNGAVSWTGVHVACDYEMQFDNPVTSMVSTSGDVTLDQTSIDGTLTQIGSGQLTLYTESGTEICDDSEGTIDVIFDNVEFDPDDSCPQDGTVTMDVDFMTSCENGDFSGQLVNLADGTHCLPLSELPH